jgi:bacillithiol biosynthesis cysteine-adding enzyme BshC
VPWVRPLAGDYVFNYGNVASLYAGDPASTDAWRKAITRAQQHASRRQPLVSVLKAQQTRRNAPAESLNATQTLLDPRSVAIVTGQQAGAFGGPLFTLLKGITAIQLARRIGETHGTPAVPVFWVDAEDHDWAEVASCTVLDAELQPRTVTLAPPEGAGERPVAHLTLTSDIEDRLSGMQETLVRSDFTDWMMSSLRTAYRPGVGMADAFARWLESVLGRYGLVVFDSADPAAKPLAADVFTRELSAPGQTARLAAAAGEALAARGHEPQVVPQPDSAALFHLDGVRRPIKHHGDSFVIGDRTVAAADVKAEASASPERFSPNVLLRPIVQDTLFPTAAYVSGPSELAYLGQLGGVYQHFGVPMPIMYPRAMATLVDSATARFLSKYDLPFQDLQPQDESALNRLLQSQLPESVEQAVSGAQDAVRRSMQRVVEVIPAVDPTLAGAAKTVLGRMEHELRGLQSKMIHAAKKRDETLRRQFTRAQAQAFPHGHPQERTLGAVFFLNRYGPALVDRLLDELPLDLGRHWILTI